MSEEEEGTDIVVFAPRGQGKSAQGELVRERRPGKTITKSDLP
jgi:hypothetical protein